MHTECQLLLRHSRKLAVLFQITNKIIDDVAEISELTGRLSAHDHLSSNPNLRRTNRIRTIHGSLAIEQNTLSLEQVTAVLNGKHVLAPPKDIAEVKNAYEIYERLDELDPYSVDDLLSAHGIMTRGLVEESGMFRTRPVGVVDQEGHILHFGTLPQYVPDLVMELLDWAKHSDLHMLIRSCVFHYEFEFIHPFADGNGRMGRLWQSLILSKFNPLFQYLPVETMVYNNQQNYYEAINDSSAKNDSGIFVDFMLGEILKTLKLHQTSQSGRVNGRLNGRVNDVLEFIRNNQGANTNDIAKALNIPVRTLSRYLKSLSEFIEFSGAPKNGGYFLK